MPARLAQHLVQKGLLSAREVEDAQRRRATHGGTLDTVLLEAGNIAEAGMLQALADVSGLRPVNLADFEPNPEMSRFVPANVAERLGAVPLSVEGDTLHVACCYPPPTRDLGDVSVLLGKKLEAWVAIETRVRDWISVVYGVPVAPRYSVLLSQLDPTRAAPPPLRAPEPPKQQKAKAAGSAVQVVDEPTLEDALTRDMVEQIARAVVEEPILLEVRKKPKANAPPPPRRQEPSPPTQPHAVPDFEETRQFDLSALAAQAKAQPEAEARPATWDRDSTVTLDLEALAKKSVTLKDEPAPKPPAAPVRPPQVAPAKVPAPPAPRAKTKTQSEFPPVVVFPDPVPAPAPAPPPKTAKAPKAAEPKPKPAPNGAAAWTLKEARAALAGASQDRDRIIDVALTFALRTFEVAYAFAVVKGAAVGWAAKGTNEEGFRQKPPTIPLDAPSVFRTVTITRGSYVGPVPQDPNTQSYLRLMERSPRTLFLFPVEVKDRLVCLLYGDPGQQPISQLKLSELLLLCQELPGAFQELILSKKQKFGASSRAALSLEEVVPQSAGMGWSPFAAPEKTGGGRIASMAPVLMEDPSRPPPDFAPLMRKLTGPDAAGRAAAVAELARTPDASARVLADHFPGPTAWSRLPVAELPDADELGPIPGALSKLGRAGAQALAALLDSDEPDVRYYALLTAGSLPFPELVGGVLRGLFDFEPDISSAARAAAAALRKLPRFQDSLPDLRKELAAVDTLRRSLAARALGVLHDRGAIEGLINLTGSDDEMTAQAAAEALSEITRAAFGPDQRRWSAWWAEMRGKTRAQWLVAALRHPEVDLRLAAIEELSKAQGDNLGYLADAPEQEREQAVRAWEALLGQSPRLKRLE